jgi:2,4-dienoyl-CoA reductase-like NADH-dependent reductase (Old Yellow Enzyme family)/thioredoxin reductase
MLNQYANQDGYITERTKNYYEARARGGVGLIIVEGTYIHLGGQGFGNQPAMSDDKYIAGMSELVQAIHKHGAKASIQLFHAGRLARSQFSGLQPVAPSPIAATGFGYEMPKELSVDEIPEIIFYFAEAALRAKNAGFDGVEIHGAHSYIIDQFLSRVSNKRDDMYGGVLSNRARFLVEVIKKVKETVGADYPVWVRITGKEYGLEEGITEEESQETARIAQEAGADAIHVSAFGPGAPNNLSQPKFVPGVIIHLAERVKKAISIPVIAVGKITPYAAEKFLAEEKADFIAMGRQLLADPELPNKASLGKIEDIKPCIDCFDCRNDLWSNIMGSNSSKIGIRCSVNSALGKEGEQNFDKTDKPKKVLVIGGGPAGMESARVAALRGHMVTIWEQRSKLGGQLISASIPPHKDRIKALIKYLTIQVKKHDVKIETDKKATKSEVERFNPDKVIIATGVDYVIPKIPGLENADVVKASDVLEEKVDVKERVLIIGGESVGLQTAEFLLEKKKKVTVVRRGPEIAAKMGPVLRNYCLNRLLDKGITFIKNIKYKEITTSGLVVLTKEDKRKTIEFDTIVLAAGSTSNKKLYNEIKANIPEIHLAGDSLKPRTMRNAVADGNCIGLEI